QRKKQGFLRAAQQRRLVTFAASIHVRFTAFGTDHQGSRSANSCILNLYLGSPCAPSFGWTPVASVVPIRLNMVGGTIVKAMSMSSFPLPDNSSVTSSPEKSPRNVEHSTLPLTPITTSRDKESVGRP